MPITACRKCRITPIITDKEAYCPRCGLKVTPGDPKKLPPKILWNRCNASANAAMKDHIANPRRRKVEKSDDAYTFYGEW